MKVGLNSANLIVLVKALAASNTLTSLSIEQTIILDPPVDAPEQISPLVDLVSEGSPLKMLSLRGNALNDASGRELFTRLAANSALTLLHLGENRFSGETCAALALCLVRRVGVKCPVNILPESHVGTLIRGTLC
jgi:hypothetical protein